MRRTGISFALLACLLLPGLALAQVQRGVDDKGRVHYGDKLPAVTMYSTSWCGYCAKARAHFAKRGIAFEERDIERSATWEREHKELGGRGVPLILVGRQKSNGYSVGSLEAMLKAEGY